MDAIRVLSDELTEAGRRRGVCRVLGIDLGTTNSTVAEASWWPDAKRPLALRCIEIEQATDEGVYTHVLVPSVVAVRHSSVMVGEGAKRLRARAGEHGLEQGRELFYECKSDMGITRTYHRAPTGYRSAAEVGGHVLEALVAGAMADEPLPVARVVVTVPASFQLAQRRDTMRAAELAGLAVEGGDLLDEPLAAFIDAVYAQGLEGLTADGAPRTLVVFDFGGGTCDIAVLRLAAGSGGRLAVTPLAVSRYHRLGGADIDRAIVHEVLIPELRRQNGLEQFQLGFEDKKRRLEPELLGVAEGLKILLCKEMARLEGFGRWPAADAAAITVTSPLVLESKVDERTLRLERPSLDAAAFERLLEPFLDTDMVFARETEYRMTCSIFAPLTDALDRARLAADAVDLVLLVGGSSLIPQVRHAVAGFFPRARVLRYQDDESLQVAVARGAALHALSLALLGRPIIQPVAHDTIALRTADRLFELIPAGAELPYPGPGSFGRREGLVIPERSDVDPVDLRVEVVAGEGSGQRLLHRARWSVPAPVRRGQPLVVEYALDSNQVLQLSLRLADDPDGPRFECAIENPLTHVVNPLADRLRLDQLEESMRTGKVTKEKLPDALLEAAGLMAKLGHRERAYEVLRTVLRARNRPDAGILHDMAELAGEMGDKKRELKLYRQAADANPGWAGHWFNLALCCKRQGLWQEARQALDESLAREFYGPSLVLGAQIAEGLRDVQERDRLLRRALAGAGDPGRMTDWELGWLITAATMSRDDEIRTRAEAERRERAQQHVSHEPIEGVLPEVRQIHLVPR